MPASLSRLLTKALNVVSHIKSPSSFANTRSSCLKYFCPNLSLFLACSFLTWRSICSTSLNIGIILFEDFVLVESIISFLYLYFEFLSLFGTACICWSILIVYFSKLIFDHCKPSVSPNLEPTQRKNIINISHWVPCSQQYFISLS